MIKVILWDIDGTLLDFGQAENYAMKKCFSVLEMGECTDAMVERYAAINTKYWERLERNEITKQEVLIGRFREFFENEGLPLEKAQLFNEEYQIRLGDKVFFNDNAKTLVEELKAQGFVQLAVTNGTLAAQRRKLAASGFDILLDGAVISDEIGVQKPNIGFFECTFGILAKIGTYQKDEIVIVGDSLTSDMQGGNNAGIVCCWYNPKEERNTKGLHIDYEIKNLMDLNKILFTN